MYAAKRTRSGGRVYQPADDRNTAHRLALIGDLRQAIDGGDQRRVPAELDPATGLVAGAEALARWSHPGHGSVPPDRFIALAEHSGLIRGLTLHVLDVALRRCAAWRHAGHDLHVAVNLSPNSPARQHVAGRGGPALVQSGVPSQSLTLEITESSIMADPAAASDSGPAARTGLRLAIDDFGTGYSSLGRLRELPIHEVKIDKSFVQRIAVDTATRGGPLGRTARARARPRRRGRGRRGPDHVRPPRRGLRPRAGLPLSGRCRRVAGG